MERKTSEQGQIESYSRDPNHNQGHNHEEDNNDEEKKNKKDMHQDQNVEDQNESAKEVVVNDNNKNKHTVQHINEPKEVLVENNDNKNKEIDAPDMKKHYVDNDCKEDEDIQHYNDGYKDGTSNNCEIRKRKRQMSIIMEIKEVEVFLIIMMKKNETQKMLRQMIRIT